MNANIEPIEGVAVGSYGQPITLTVVNGAGVAQDVSGYSAIAVVAVSPDLLNTKTPAGTYVGTGTDGKVYFTFVAGDLDREGDWTLQIEFSKTGEVFKTDKTILKVWSSAR